MKMNEVNDAFMDALDKLDHDPYYGYDSAPEIERRKPKRKDKYIELEKEIFTARSCIRELVAEEKSLTKQLNALMYNERQLLEIIDRIHEDMYASNSTYADSAQGSDGLDMIDLGKPLSRPRYGALKYE